MTELQTRFTTEGLVIKEMSVGESDRLVTLFTRDYGIIKAFAPGVKSVKSKRAPATALLTYSSFSIQKRGDIYRIYEASPITAFFTLDGDIAVITICQYFCELAGEFGESGNPNTELLRLILNSLHFLVKEKRQPELIKAITELRVAVISGYMPDLVACPVCGKFEDDVMYFSLRDGSLRCKDCPKGNDEVAVDRTLLSALRHISFSQLGKLYSFEIPVESARRLSKITSGYLTMQTEHRFSALEFYNNYVLSE
ncbi:MAG: DNA repair protein RecO [Clostridia bacterium]|nr:DNA repair protein RecO [Clostridia bacterium]